MEDKRRLKILSITPEILLKLIAAYPRKDRTPIYDPPDDLQSVGAGWDPERHCFYLTVSHPSFEIVPETDAIAKVPIDLSERNPFHRKPLIDLG